jgi:hypothetical protein
MGENHIFVREEALQEQEGNASHLCVNDHATFCPRISMNDEVVGVRGGVGER